MIGNQLGIARFEPFEQHVALGGWDFPAGDRARHDALRFRFADALPSSTQAGAWSLVLSSARGRVSTPAASSRFAAGLFSSRWSMRMPALRSNERRQ